MNKLNITILFFTALIFSCNSKQKNQTSSTNLKMIEEGKAFAESNCISCHSHSANRDTRLAPPFFAVKKHYIDENTNYSEFKNELSNFLNNPSEDKSKMPGALSKFGLMPKLTLSESEIEKIANYIFYTDFHKPSWFDEHHKNEMQKEVDSLTSEQKKLKKGQGYALKTKKVLGENLMQAITNGGTENALAFCNIKALPLTDSMAKLQGVTIKRVSDKNRNPKNNASEMELEYIEYAKALLQEKKEITSKISLINNKWVGYYPIITNKMCTQCHGEPTKDISETTLQKIKQLYPNDLAINYKENQLRGIWVVEMEDEK